VRAASIRHVVTAWAQATGRKAHPTFADTLAPSATAAQSELEAAVASREYLRYADWMSGHRVS